MRTLRTISALTAAAFLGGCTPEYTELKGRLAEINEQLETLPKKDVNSFTPTLGFLTHVIDSPHQTNRVQITFSGPKSIDMLVLVPLNFLNRNSEYLSNGFPVRYRIEAQTPDGRSVTLVDRTEADVPDPGIAPVVFTLPAAVEATGVSIVATQLAEERSWRSNKYIFALSEVLVFDGEENVALNAEVISPNPYRYGLVFAPEYLVDGYTYFPPLLQYHEKLRPNYQPRVMDREFVVAFDLEQHQTFNEARFFPVDFTPQFSHIHSLAVGFPSKISMTVSDRSDFSGALPYLIEHTDVPINMSEAPLCRKLPPMQGRYVRFTFQNGRGDPRINNPKKSRYISLSEVQLLHKGQNLLTGIPFSTDNELLVHPGNRTPQTTLTDGKTGASHIVPDRTWFAQLARRAELTTQKEALLDSQDRSVRQLEQTIQHLLLGSGALVLLFLCALLFARYRAQKTIQAVRDRIADDLHDETGASLSGIANSAQLLEELLSDDISDKENELLTDIIGSAKRSATEIRSLIQFLEQDSDESDLIERFRATAAQMLYGLNLIEDFRDANPFNQLPPIQKWDLLLFFKEALNNIIKHSDADAVEISTRKEGKSLLIEIKDNGQGLPPDVHPTHLMKRARKLNAKIEVSTPETGGTLVICTLPRT